MEVQSKLMYGHACKSADQPLLSIMIPTFNRGQTLVRAIDSAINQNKLFSFEVIVVSNNPEDDFKDLIDRYKDQENLFFYKNDENIGMVRNSNRCVELARGKYVAFLHDDDYLLDNYSKVINDFINGFDGKCLITGRYLEYENGPRKIDKIKKIIRKIYFIPDLYRKKIKSITIKDCLRSDINTYYSPSCGTIFEKEAFLSIGGFDNNIPYSFDIDFFLRFNLKYKVYETTEMCAVYSIGNNASLKPEVRRLYFWYYVENHIPFFEKNHIDDVFIQKNRNMLIYSMYVHSADVVSKEELGFKIDRYNKARWYLFRVKCLMYYFNHNLDIQRIR